MKHLIICAALLVASPAFANGDSDSDSDEGNGSGAVNASLSVVTGSRSDVSPFANIPVAPTADASLSEVAAICNTNANSEMCKIGTDVIEARFTPARLFVIKWLGWIPVLGRYI